MNVQMRRDIPRLGPILPGISPIGSLALLFSLAAVIGCGGDPTPSELGQETTASSTESKQSSTSSVTIPSQNPSFPDSTDELNPSSSSGATGTIPETSTSDSTTTSNPTSSNPTSSDDSSSSTDHEPLPKVRIQIKPGSELCGLANDMGTTIREGFTSKQKIYLDKATIKTGDLKFNGTLQNGDRKLRFQAELAQFRLRDQPSGNHAFLAVQQPAAFADTTPFKLGLSLSQWPGDDTPSYIIDDWTELAPAEDYNSVHISSTDPLDILGGNKRAMFGACRFPEQKPEVFAFEFPNGDRIEFTTKTRLLNNRRQYQRGLLLGAKGTFKGIDFEVNAWENLVYAVREYALSPRRPELAVQFPKQDGICGLWLAPQNPDDSKAPYVAFVINCDFEKIDTLEPSSWTIPPRFG